LSLERLEDRCLCASLSFLGRAEPSIPLAGDTGFAPTTAAVRLDAHALVPDRPPSVPLGAAVDASPEAGSGMADREFRRGVAGGYSDQSPDRDDGPSQARRGSAAEYADGDQRLAARRDLFVRAVAWLSVAETGTHGHAADQESVRPLPPSGPAQPVNAAQPAEQVPVSPVAAAERLGPLIAAHEMAGPSPPPVLASGAGSGLAATAQAPAEVPPESSGDIPTEAPAAANTAPIGGWLPVDLAALERGLESLVARLSPLGGDEPWGMTVARIGFCLMGVWAAYELVRPRHPDHGVRLALADAAPGQGGGGPWPWEES
jgi:hypothetical protein